MLRRKFAAVCLAVLRSTKSLVEKLLLVMRKGAQIFQLLNRGALFFAQLRAAGMEVFKQLLQAR